MIFIEKFEKKLPKLWYFVHCPNHYIIIIHAKQKVHSRYLLSTIEIMKYSICDSYIYYYYYYFDKYCWFLVTSLIFHMQKVIYLSFSRVNCEPKLWLWQSNVHHKCPNVISLSRFYMPCVYHSPNYCNFFMHKKANMKMKNWKHYPPPQCKFFLIRIYDNYIL